MRKTAFTLAFCLLAALQVFGQKSSLSFGINTTYFSDWDKRPFNLLNPEIMFSKKVQRNFILMAVDGFYGKSPAGQSLETGDVYDRLIFSLKANYAVKSKNLLLGLGPAVRYRNEKRFKNVPPGYDFVGKLNEEYFDFGLNGSVLYMFITGKNSISLKLSYSAYNRGKNPLSIGVFYDWRWK
jgi:hypothetical protein